MSHLDEERLAALALGEGDAADAAHAADCAACAVELDALRAMVERLEGMDVPEGPLLAPPSRVWDGVVDAVARGASASDGDDVPQAGGAVSEATVDELAPRRRGMPTWVAGVAAAAGVVVGGVGVAAVLTLGDRDAGTVVAEAALTDLATDQPAGTAVVEERADGTRVLVLDTVAEEPQDAYLEVWLIDSDVEGMISLGHLADGVTEFVIPAGFDVSAFPIVDVSIEPLDGVPTHSGDSITRGVLDT